jgi:uncharacterized coiled-coil protein SlyX
MIIPHQRDDAKLIADLRAAVAKQQTDIQRLQKLVERLTLAPVTVTKKP